MMLSGIRLGKFFGVEVSLHWSVLVLAYLGFNICMGKVAQNFESPNFVLSIITSSIVAVLFITSVLAHELAHVTIGRKLGIGFDGITMFALGGVAKMSSQPHNAKTEFLMAGAGPLCSLVLGVLFIVLAYLMAAFPIHSNYIILGSLLLGLVNISLGIFNLLPMFPCDGGRLVRSGLWALTGNLKISTYIAGYSGMAFAVGFVLIGLAMCAGINVPVFGTGIGNGIWTGLIGALLFAMARAEVNHVRRR